MMYDVLPNSFRLARYLAPVALLVFVPLVRPSADDCFPPPDAKGGWRTLSDPAKIAKTAGVDKQKLDEAFEYVQNTSQHGGLLVVRHGTVYGIDLLRAAGDQEENRCHPVPADENRASCGARAGVASPRQ